MAKKPFAYAALEGIRQEMKSNPKLSVCFGQGTNTATSMTGDIIDLQDEFKGPRVLTDETQPIDEGWYAGWASGMAVAGNPTLFFLPHMAHLVATETIYSNIAKLGYGSGGGIKQPVTIWVNGAYRQIGQSIQHTDAGQEAIYIYMPGLKVVMPNDAYDGKGLLISALRDPDPVVYYVYSKVSSTAPVEVPDEAYTIPIGKAFVKQEGKDLTLVAWGNVITEVDKALAKFKDMGISVEYIQPRTLKPFDTETLAASVKKTGRLLVVDEGPYTGTFSSHVIAEAAQRVRGALVKKITFPDAPGPGAQEMIEWMTPDAPKIIDAVQQMVKM
ncbi:MAG TPA: transketolase C-terminal domain-containing protein [Anaerolineae bacterium]